MKVLLRLICFIALLIFSLEADECQEREETINRVSSANEIDIRPCPLNPDEKKGDIIWYKNDSKTPISTAQDSRIHQHKNQLWFVPAKVEDSGHYYCAVRNSSYCLKIKISPKFVENEPNVCYNAEAIFTQRLPVERDGKLVCPYLEFFKDENNEFPKLQWYKNCQPLLLDNTHFGGAANQLVVKNVAKEHGGNYTCRASYTYLGKQHSVTRVIAFITLEGNRPLRPVIVSPANETMEVELGSHIQLICNVTGHLSDYVYWKWNGSITEDDPVLEEEYHFVENPSDKRRSTLITVLNISEVESRFYLRPFTCLAKNTHGLNVAYIQLIHPVPDFQKHVIGVFVLLTVIITCSVFIYKIFKIDIVLWYRDSCYIFLPPKASDGKTYDAYILYPKTLGEGSTSNSDIFVFKVLPEVLEKQCGYKLFIYGRDDYVGEDIVEVINENIKKSRRLIIILVREMSSFGWLGSSSEEQIAMYNALIRDGIKVVLLELEKIQDYEKMPESIKFIKRKHGAIRWSGDFTEGPQSVKTRFWKSVRYHMPDQRRPSSTKHQLLSLATRPDFKERLQREVHLPLG
ncbi:interleukin-1 receptor type 1 isoform X2 [Nycticebus coucang]|nr:interleukin-1 receptor type 1 isoform X2 [Nycticebus coucang]XP_053443318.1 interleukin-1 receptor type 1 isoform X2 [Nycticebus coucang]XP_053443319.1 interleukin-1 receptor type 1 isoform X2 [Nycticebus coucang]XP_053443320.1 interleukin-1 receptor type 1 isoform X2 [Nycticebus coucang]XP_053443321.1 interleukin-1 receptor type 1 isoform X2 [Nycticebus coucang]XP_053443322.1 interleukin-1 receptor type 1 isoform X2 [Nycticebus coucang]XP_053443323.1 interleukin-1 receptor type 1 isoform 